VRAGLIAAFLAVPLVVGQQTAGSAEKGNELFDEQCASCHFAYSADRKTGPGLKLLFAKEKLESNGKPVTDSNVLDLLDKGAKGMPAFKEAFSADDKSDLLAYLKTL
jgi:mono/diheme cytochrome c family protein